MLSFKYRHAFSMIELIFVIVILGIVSSIGAEVIANVYESYIVQRAEHRSSIKTQLAMNQIANRLRYAIKDTFVYDNSHLQWVASDGDSFEAIANSSNRKPGWSGFCDINNSSATSLSTPGSNLGLANNIQLKLGNTSGKFAVYFPGEYDSNGPISHTAMGSGTTITLDNPATTISERYKLAWTSYALKIDASGDLNLYYNFSPTYNASTTGASKVVLLKNVTNFKYIREGDTIRFKICVKERVGDTEYIPSCKEKAVF